MADENNIFLSVVVESLSHVWVVVTPWTVACQAFLSFLFLFALIGMITWEITLSSTVQTFYFLSLKSNSESAFEMKAMVRFRQWQWLLIEDCGMWDSYNFDNWFICTWWCIKKKLGKIELLFPFIRVPVIERVHCVYITYRLIGKEV